jgi:hypothetical protein
MANYYATARSNYFKVKNAEAFAAWVADWPTGLKLLEKDTEAGETLHGFYCDDGDGGGFQCDYQGDDDEGNEIDRDMLAELAEHLVEGQVAVLEEAGAEKLRYVSAFSIAVNHKGQTITIHINDIYDRVKKEWGAEVNEATY